MQVKGQHVSTEVLPRTKRLLKMHLPSILRSKCFNENNYSFSKEVKNTEIGHLFEHIVLEYLCNYKIAAGHRDPVHNGLTSWNWKEEKRGLFHITFDAGERDSKYLDMAIEQAIILTVRIMQSEPLIPQNLPNRYFSSLPVEVAEFT